MGNEKLIEEVEALQEALEASEKVASEGLVKGAALTIQDRSDLGKKYMNAKALAAMEKRSKQLVKQFDDGRVYICMYLAKHVRDEESHVDQAAQEIANIVNELADQDLIESTLTPMSYIKLARMPLQVQSAGVFCFVLVPAEKLDELNKKYDKHACAEGEFGKTVPDLRHNLAPGEFLAVVRVSTFLAEQEHIDTKKLFDSQIEQYLKILPRGTVVNETTDCAVLDLSKSTEVKFYNPLLQRVARVDLDYVREVAVIGEKLEQFNLLMGVRYFDRDDKELYR